MVFNGECQTLRTGGRSLDFCLLEFSDLEIVALSLAAELEDIDSEKGF